MTLPLGIVASGYLYPSVSGGTLTSDATYYYRTFTVSGDLIISNGPLSGDILLWGGGGGGGSMASTYSGSGGGGGGYYNIITFSNTAAGTYAVTVGAGGASSTNGNHFSIFGNNSGRGTHGDSGYTLNYADSAVFSPGNNSTTSPGYGGVGGAGAGGNGGNHGWDGTPGNGGSGASVWGTIRGSGGRGGYGYFATRVNTPVANANTSDGGGGRSYTYDGNYGFMETAGGSGVVIVRYLRSAVGG
jgi:hypothetical protein